MSNFASQKFNPYPKSNSMPHSTPVYLLLGSNLGDRKRILSAASVQLEEAVGPLLSSSALYEPSPWGLTNQPAFLNQVLCLETQLSPEEVLQQTQRVENQLGRERKEKWGARLIDIDILYYGQQIIRTDRLTVPHPFLHERRFTLVPLAQIAPDFVHPVLGLSNLILLEQCEDTGEVKMLED
jgi:2-amino-4-hydroxy-6-hydroxymethyldihydropteridine diphosphokinase